MMGFLHLNCITTEEWKELTKHDGKVKTMEQRILDHRKCPTWYYNELTRRNLNNKYQTHLVKEFCYQTKINTQQYLTINDIETFEIVLNVDVLVVCARMGNKFLRVPSKDSTKQRLYVYLVEGENGMPHFHTIVNISGFFDQPKVCEECLKPYKDKHDCEVCCWVYKTKGCLKTESIIICDMCNMTCRSLDCFQRHKTVQDRKNKELKSACQLHWKCSTCKKVLNTEKR